MRVILTPQAQLDFEAQVRWLARHSPAAGRAAAVRIVEVIDLLSDFPNLGMSVYGLFEKSRFGSAATAS